MDATIIEVAFHDSVEDAAAHARPEGARPDRPRSIYEGTFEYFDNCGGLTDAGRRCRPRRRRPRRQQRQRQRHAQLDRRADRRATARRADRLPHLHVANGYGFDGGTVVAGGGTTSATITGLRPERARTTSRSSPTNAGGESQRVGSRGRAAERRREAACSSSTASTASTARGTSATRTRITGDGLVDRVFAALQQQLRLRRAGRRRDPGRPARHARRQHQQRSGHQRRGQPDAITTPSSGSAARNRPPNDTFNATEQTKVEQFIAAGGNLFVTGAEIGWDLDQQNNGRSFYETRSRPTTSPTTRGRTTWSAVGRPAGRDLRRLELLVRQRRQFYDVDFPDVHRAAIRRGDGAELQRRHGRRRGASQSPARRDAAASSIFGFPFETITTAAGDSRS